MKNTSRREFLRGAGVGAIATATGLGAQGCGSHSSNVWTVVGASYLIYGLDDVFYLIGRTTRDLGILIDSMFSSKKATKETNQTSSNRYEKVHVEFYGNSDNQEGIDRIINGITDYVSNHCVDCAGSDLTVNMLAIPAQAMKQARETTSKGTGQIANEIKALEGAQGIYQVSNPTVQWLTNYAQSNGILAQVQRTYAQGATKPSLTIKLVDLASNV